MQRKQLEDPSGIRYGKSDNSVCRRVLRWMLLHGKPATPKEIAQALNLPLTSTWDALRKNEDVFVLAGHRHDGYRPRPLYAAWEE